MELKHKFTVAFLKLVGEPRIKRLQAKQRAIKNMPGVILPTLNSPSRFDIPLEIMRLLQKRDDIKMRHIFPVKSLYSIVKNIHLSVDSLQDNPTHPKPIMPTEFREELEDYIFTLGVDLIGYTKLPHSLIFQEFGVLYDNAIILAMEMNKEIIDKAPSQATLNMIFETYDSLGKAANKIAEYLRTHGYAAQADHPSGGLVLFPPLAQKAGIGWVGNHGLLITREFGPRVRLAAVYTNIENLPFSDLNTHKWIENYCRKCELCVHHCPAKAILTEPIIHDNGQITHISQEDCFGYFAQFYGCSICIKVCPFSMGAEVYDRLKTLIEKD